MDTQQYGSSESSESSENSENSYCILLHIVEGIGFNIKDAGTDLAEHRRSRIVLDVSLNGVKFEVEGHSLSNETATIFNSNCIWECELCDIKRMKTDNRPVKLECFWKTRKSELTPRRSVGTLLLPIRGVQILSSLANATLKLHWHKLGALGSEWRANKPEIYLMLIIVKKSILDSGQLETFMGKRKSHRPSVTSSRGGDLLHSPNISDTALMLQSQHNIYVQLLEQVGLIQVGNNPDLDTDILCVTLTFKQMKYFLMLLQSEQSNEFTHSHDNVFVFHYDFLGSNSYVEVQMMPSDCYTINEKISLTFKSSLQSLRMYFQCIFYVPVNIYYQGAIIANYRFDFSKLLPKDNYFTSQRLWMKTGTFYFERMHKTISPMINRPSVDYIFSIQLMTLYDKKNNYDGALQSMGALSLVPTKDEQELLQNLNPLQNSQIFKKMCSENSILSSGHFKEYVEFFRKYHSTNSDILSNKEETESLPNDTKENNIELLKNSDNFNFNFNKEKQINLPNQIDSVSKKVVDKHIATDKPIMATIGINTEQLLKEVEFNQDDLCLKAVQELEEWKQQQMECFLEELSRKEHNYVKELKQVWESKRLEMEARLEAKLTKCERLNEELEKANAELSYEKCQDRLRLAENIKKDFEESYVKKFMNLDSEVQRLKADMQRHEKVFEMRSEQIQMENERLHQEKLILKSHIEQLEKKFLALEDTQIPADQLKNALSDLKIQNEQFMAMEKSRNYYKQQWWKASQQIQKLNIKILQMQGDECCRDKDFNLALDDILNEEHELLKSDRQELNSVKEVLFNITDSSSDDGDVTRISNSP